MKKYIFLTFDISWVGGGQCYVASKARYLESQGWDVYVISAGNSHKTPKCPIDYLNRFIPYMQIELHFPPHILPKVLVDIELRKLRKMISSTDGKNEIIIESHDDIMALWGELLAKQLLARHFFWTANEHYRLPTQYYKEKMDLFLFKLDRKEIFGSCSTVNRLLEGYRTVTSENFEGVMIDEDPVQDVVNDKVDNLKKYDWTICYIGRSNKLYMTNIISDVGLFASCHKDKRIQFVIVGDIGLHSEELKAIDNINDNLIITELGNLHPLPRNLFKKVDVVIAGSGSARCSVYEGTMTIVADPETGMSIGMLGYDTITSVYKEKEGAIFSFDEVLERALVKKVYTSMVNRFPPKKGVAACTKQNFELIEKAASNLEYFDEKEICKGKKNYRIALGIVHTKVRNVFA